MTVVTVGHLQCEFSCTPTQRNLQSHVFRRKSQGKILWHLFWSSPSFLLKALGERATAFKAPLASFFMKDDWIIGFLGWQRSERCCNASCIGRNMWNQLALLQMNGVAWCCCLSLSLVKRLNMLYFVSRTTGWLDFWLDLSIRSHKSVKIEVKEVEKAPTKHPLEGLRTYGAASMRPTQLFSASGLSFGEPWTWMRRCLMALMGQTKTLMSLEFRISNLIFLSSLISHFRIAMENKPHVDWLSLATQALSEKSLGSRDGWWTCKDA